MGFTFVYYRASDTYVTNNQEVSMQHLRHGDDVRCISGTTIIDQSVKSKKMTKQDGPDQGHPLQFILILKANSVQILTDIPQSKAPQYSFSHPLSLPFLGTV